MAGAVGCAPAAACIVRAAGADTPVGSEATLESLIQLVPAILEAIGSGERDPQSPGELARGTLRNKIQQLVDTLRGMFTDHHAFVTGGYLTQSRRPPS